MSLHAEPRSRGRGRAGRWCGLLALLALLAAPAGAQSIADYSQAQRAAIEAAMTQAAARAVAPASAAARPSAAALVSAASAPNASPALAPRQRIEHGEPAVQVTGVFETASRGLAEIDVDGRVYLLAVGQRVPGSPWQVETIAADRVVLGRDAARSPARVGAAAVRRTFALPALR